MVAKIIDTSGVQTFCQLRFPKQEQLLFRKWLGLMYDWIHGNERYDEDLFKIRMTEE